MAAVPEMIANSLSIFRRTVAKSKSFRFQSLRAMSSASDEVTMEKIGNKGVITLNRPNALNALSLEMIRKIYPELRKWDTDSELKMVIIKAKEGKAFCSGGDVRAIVESKGSDLGEIFFKEEYRLNNLIGTLTIPYVALLNGITMGGGVGLSIHGTFRVATEKCVFAMPETAIGFFPDVGGSYFLPRLPGKLGLFLGLTGYRLVGWDVMKARIASHFVSSDRLKILEDDLMRLDKPSLQDIDKILVKHQDQCEQDFRKEFSLKKYMGRINSAFDAPSVEKIIENLKKDTSDWAKEQLEVFQKVSPLSLKVTFKEIQEGVGLTLQDALKMEYRISQRFMADNDFYEGVTAAVIDKNKTPQWKPATLEEVTDEKVNSYFEPLSTNKELRL